MVRYALKNSSNNEYRPLKLETEAEKQDIIRSVKLIVNFGSVKLAYGM
jgi:hypothetical protein